METLSMAINYEAKNSVKKLQLCYFKYFLSFLPTQIYTRTTKKQKARKLL